MKVSFDSGTRLSDLRLIREMIDKLIEAKMKRQEEWEKHSKEVYDKIADSLKGK